MEWNDCSISEYVNETEIRVKIPQSIFDVDEYTSVICRLSYPSGVIEGEKRYSQNLVLEHQKKEDPKTLTSTQLIIIIASSCAFSIIVVVAIIVTAVCIVKRKKRRQYKPINDTK
ncbi:uncharacterized protein MONOS_711 [Monocercomonoides exilis]|uniref:uncharacterized protein n=1 Tax=Monocercomonoides exilis TaxID=2049356 RepID=UPI00355A1D91|nr:hypothetical protein MONOS_711 [Monocercomonoides exilis]|eukprot:MONOS_711.1-p1 / transcript=MONOS_711.1 / gene=MONOS_711 / organism=Monocercomonoides_exilis_PA203 / gene_product=unspecified product / transcript_product=unspecified product / location=Mono_scaffold00012:37862-38206(-) / protein_length=115 / sequence_SO=supercontig / SO=protein_coding / is_pseudo=false